MPRANKYKFKIAKKLNDYVWRVKHVDRSFEQLFTTEDFTKDGITPVVGLVVVVVYNKDTKVYSFFDESVVHGD